MEIPFKTKDGGTPKEPPMVHDYGMTPPIPCTDIHFAMQEIEAQGQEPLFAFVAGAMRNPALVLEGGAPQTLPAAFVVFRSKTVRAYTKSITPYLQIGGAKNGKGP